MSQARAAAGPDRLPWLADEPPPPKKRAKTGELAGWAAAAILLVAGASYWMGAHSWPPVASQPQVRTPSTTVPLPQPRAPEPAQPQVTLEPVPQVTPVPQREVPMARPRVEKRAVERGTAAPTAPKGDAANEKQAAAGPAPEPVAGQAPPPAVAPADRPLTPWPAWQSQGAYGRIVRIGAFGTREQAKLGWRYMVQAYPAVAQLKATVVRDSNSRGRHFYRFQIGTTSQAHSEVLCQRMEKIRLSCAVVGLPWKPKGVER